MAQTMVAWRTWVSGLFLLFALLWISGCDEIRTDPPSTGAPVAVDPLFQEFYLYHGGKEVLGPAISPAVEVDGTVIQYTQNGILLYDPQAPASQRFQLAPLSEARQGTGGARPRLPTQAAALPTAESLTGLSPSTQREIQVWEAYPILAPGQSQEIRVSISENELPLSRAAVDLTLTLPDGTTRTYSMDPTGQDGQTWLSIEAIPAEAAARIPYQVCVVASNQQKFCVQKSFLIWFPDTGAAPTVQPPGQKILIPLILSRIHPPDG